MTEKKKRFVEESKPLGFVFDMEQEKRLYLDEVIDLLNEQQTLIENLRKRVKELEIENEALQDSNDALAEDMFHRLEEVI